MDILESISMLNKNKKRFNIIFLDPPYHLENIEGILKSIVTNDLLAGEGYIILERSSALDAPKVEGLEIFKEKTYKTTTFSFMKGLS
jgi:16S rRNA G966 N2-methylase RsmD